MLQNLSMFSGAQIEPRDWEGAENHSFAAPVSPLKFQSGARGGVFCSLLLRGGQFFLKTFNQGDLSHLAKPWLSHARHSPTLEHAVPIS